MGGFDRHGFAREHCLDRIPRIVMLHLVNFRIVDRADVTELALRIENENVRRREDAVGFGC